MVEISLKVKGMMCGGCENRVKNALGNIDGIEKVDADYTTGNVIVYCNNTIDKKIIEETILDIGYEIIRND